MTKQSINRGTSSPQNQSKDIKPSQNQEKSGTGSLIRALRTDMVPASQAIPAEKHFFQRINYKLIIGILIGLAIIGLLWLGLAGPGRPLLEQGLAGLVDVKATPTLSPSPPPATSTPTSIPTATQTPIPPSKTPASSPTSPPTVTAIRRATNTLVPVIRTATHTPTPACRDALSITLADVGKMLCIKGILTETITNPKDFLMLFSYEPGTFYLVSYDLVLDDARAGACYTITGEIMKLLNSPVLVFDFRNPPQVCP